jgi:hypothetical protein
MTIGNHLTIETELNSRAIMVLVGNPTIQTRNGKRNHLLNLNSKRAIKAMVVVVLRV